MTTPKQQFNIYLEPRLVAEVKHRAIDEQLSLSDLVANVLHIYLQTPIKETNTVNSETSGLKLQPIIHVKDMAASINFYTALGGVLLTKSRDGDWAQLALGGAEIGLLAHPPNPEQGEGVVELSFTSEGSLDTLQQHLATAGVNIIRGAADESFGAQLQVSTPDGLLIKINEIDPTTFE
jgi:catechol 2,3-dioxygenase-like lactoylglutathione lyase family enzyme